MKEGKNFINKNKYDDIKRMDHREMNEYINGVRKAEYEKGYAAGLKEAETRINSTAKINFDILEKNLTQVSGIGPVRAGYIVEIVRGETEKNEEKTESETNRK